MKKSKRSKTSKVSNGSKAKGKGTRPGWCFSGLNIHHFNTNRADKKAEVELLIEDLDLDILVIGESWLTGTLDQQLEQHGQLQIDDFSYVRFDRTNRDGGGLIIYIRRTIRFSVTTFFEWTERDLNLQYVELAIDCPFQFDLVAIYNPPNYRSKQLVQRLMDALLKHSIDSINPVMFIGDMNIARERPDWKDPVPILSHLDLDHDDERTVAALFQRFEVHYYAEALITDPTCDTNSCIDHIITNIHTVPAHRPVSIIGSGVNRIPIDRKFADHALIWCEVNGRSPLGQQQQNIFNYLLRLSDGKSEQTKIDNKGGKVGQSKNLSHKAQVISRLIEDGKRISCKVTHCGKKVDTYDEMKQHVHENHFPCTACDKVFKSKYYGPDHMERKHGIYMCRDVHCNGLRFNDSQERDAHENDGNHYACKQCKPENRRASSSYVAYKKHQKSHRQQPKIMKGFMVKDIARATQQFIANSYNFELSFCKVESRPPFLDLLSPVHIHHTSAVLA